MTKKVCIMGTAPTWKDTPWHDTSWEVWGVNDGYMLGPRRFDRWYDLHPIDKMWFRPVTQRVINPNDVPKGAYIRPEGHLEWLKTQAERMPVFLQAEPPADWPANAHRFPVEAIESAVGDYWASGPAFMLAQAVMEGYTEIMVTGIHLATEAEYREQRPNWENLIGRALGWSVTRDDQNGFRVYRGERGVSVWLPDAKKCPILAHGWKYAYEHKPDPPPNPYRDELKRTIKQKNKLIEQLVTWPVGESKDAALEQLSRLAIIEEDCQQQLQRASIAEQYAPVRAVLGG